MRWRRKADGLPTLPGGSGSPVAGGGRACLAGALHAAENMLVPACLTVCLLDAGGRSAAVAQYGSLKGMALPLLTFPFGLLGSLRCC